MIDIEDIDHIPHLEIDTGVDPDTDQGQKGHIPPVDTTLIHHVTIDPILHIIQEDLTPDILSLLDIIKRVNISTYQRIMYNGNGSQGGLCPSTCDDSTVPSFFNRQ